MRPQFTIWFTGLPSAGKSTLARLVEAQIRGRGFPVILLDGDEVRTWLTAGLGYSREDREENMRRIAHLAAFQNRAGMATITAAISPYQRARDAARQVIGRFVEVYVECPLAVCEARDVKGLYKKARRGEVHGFTGVSDPYEPPVAPEVVVRTDRESAEECVARIVERVEELDYLPHGLVRSEALLPADVVNGLGPDASRLLALIASGEVRRIGTRLRVTAEEWQQMWHHLRTLGYLQ